MMQVERVPSPTLQNGRDVSETSCASVPQLFDFLSAPPPSGVVASVSESGNTSSIPSDVPVEPSEPSIAYSDVVRGPVNPSEPDVYVPDPQNELPSRPLTVFFNPRSRLPASEVFDALQTAGLENSSLSCIQRQSSGEIVLTFRNTGAKERFLSHNVVNIRNQSFALQDVDRPLTYLQVFDAPHEMPDATIIQRLAKYCDILHHRRGHFREPGWQHVQDSVRHYRIRVKRHIPNYIRFGKILVHFRYEGQPHTCRLCNQTGHYVNACHSIICYNYEELGHLASNCPTDILCNICKQPDHRASICPFSWSRQIENTTVDAAVTENELPAETDQPDSPIPTESSPEQPELSEQPESPPPELMDDIEPSLDDSPDPLTPTETPELFDNTPTPADPAPKPKSGSRRQPANVSPTVIPTRTPTQPVIVAGKSREELTTNTDVSMDSELTDNELKRKIPDRPRTNKHKKHR